jgi:hypothetical protein
LTFGPETSSKISTGSGFQGNFCKRKKIAMFIQVIMDTKILWVEEFL